MKLVYTLRSLVFSVLFACITVIICILFSPFLAIKSKHLYWAGILWCKISLFLLRIICGIKYKIQGKAHLPKTQYIIASKHESAFETILFWELFYIPSFILKQELTKIPFFGYYLKRMDMICIDRSAGTKSLKHIISESSRHLGLKRKVIIYPEGTRAISTQQKKLNPGIFAIYKNCNTPVVPITLNSGTFWPSSGWTKYPGIITIKISKPIQVGLDKESFMEQLSSNIR